VIPTRSPFPEVYMTNPYWGADFFGWWITLFSRMGTFFRGGLVSDEVQLLVLICVSIACSCIGTFLVLRKMSMVANALSHTILLGLVAAYLILGVDHHFVINTPVLILAALISSVITSLSIWGLQEGMGVQKDASIGLVFTLLFAIGIVAISTFTRNAHIGVEVIMGNVDALSMEDVWLSLGLLVTNGVLCTIFYREFVVSSFDLQFARHVGIPLVFVQAVITLMTSATVVGSLRSVGVVLVLSLLIGPPLIARTLTNHVGKMMAIASGIAVASSMCAVALARHSISVYDLPLSTGGILVSLLFVLFLFSAVRDQLVSRHLTSPGASPT